MRRGIPAPRLDAASAPAAAYLPGAEEDPGGGPLPLRSSREERPAQPAGLDSSRGPPIPAMARKLADALPDGAALVAGDGAITMANWRLGAMFGFGQAEVPGLALESLIPALSHRAASVPGLWTGTEESGARLVGLRRDWTTFPVEVWLSPVITGQLTLAVIRDVTAGQPGGPAASAPAAGQARDRESLEMVVISLFQIGLILQNGLARGGGPVGPGIVQQALQCLDDTIREIRDRAFTAPR